jgi:hypothetical protein
MPLSQKSSTDPKFSLGSANSYGGEKWRRLTQRLGDTVRGPKLYLGYYNMAPYGPLQNSLNVDSSIMYLLMNCVEISNSNLNFDSWLRCWLQANLYYHEPAAAIDARDPDNMVYWAVFIGGGQWTSGIIYPDLDTSVP